MPYVKTINEDGVVSDIMAKALDPTLDATLLHTSNLINGFTQTTAGQNALDAAAGKSLNDSLSNCATKAELANHFKFYGSGSMQSITESGVYFVGNSVTDKPTGGGGIFILAKANATTGAGIFLGNATNSVPYGVSIMNGTWTYHAL